MNLPAREIFGGPNGRLTGAGHDDLPDVGDYGQREVDLLLAFWRNGQVRCGDIPTSFCERIHQLVTAHRDERDVQLDGLGLQAVVEELLKQLRPVVGGAALDRAV